MKSHFTTRAILTILVFLFSFISGTPLQASSHPAEPGHTCSHASCQGALGAQCDDTSQGNPMLEIYGSGQNNREMPMLREASREVYEVCVKYGITVPPALIRFLTATDMAAITSAGGHPAPHAIDGAKVLQGARNAAGIYEVVMPGTPTHTQYVRDTNTLHETLLVLAHVGGHFDFAEHTPYFKLRDPDQIRYSYELAQYMQRLYSEYDRDEVAQFYQWLLTAQFAQDVTRGSFDPPELFQIEQTQNSRPRHPSRPSEGILQSLVHNLPPTAPAWQREMVRLFERQHRSLPGYFQTKVMNEGWATFLEYFILARTKHSTEADAIRFGQINSGVRWMGLENPYWLGSEGWFRLWARFRERPEIKDLPTDEQDRLFIQEAHHIIETRNDYQFVREALDKTWVERYNLFLKRPVDIDDQPSKKETEHDNQYAITRDSERIATWIANRISNRDWAFPKIEVVDLNHRDEGGILFRHKDVLDIPLRRASMVKALYVYAQIYRRTVTLETIGSTAWFPSVFSEKEPTPPWWHEEIWGPYPWGRVTPQVPRAFPMKVSVSPRGVINLEIIDDLGLEPLKDGSIRDRLLKAAEKNLATFRQDVMMSHSPHKIQCDLEFLQSALLGPSQVSDSIIRLCSHAPTAAKAIEEFLDTATYRLDQTLHLWFDGKWNIHFPPGAKNFRVRILAEVPMFELDTGVKGKRGNWIAPTQPERHYEGGDSADFYLRRLLTRGGPLPTGPRTSRPSGGRESVVSYPDEDLTIAQGHRLPGESWFEPPQPEEPSQPGDPSDDESEDGEEKPGTGAGDGGGDPSVIDVPAEVWGKFLAEKIELRNLRKTMGENEEVDSVRSGSVKQSQGSVQWARTSEEAISIGLAMQRRQKLLDRKKKPQDASSQTPAPRRRLSPLQVGFNHMTPSDMFFSDREPEPVPETDAVIVWIRDTSGSMGPEKRKIITDYVFNTRLLLKTKYPFLKERFVIYSSGARETTEKEFFTLNEGGGTDTYRGLDLGRQILEEYPHSKYNRFSAVFSDGDDGNTEMSIAEARKLADLCEHTSYGHIDERHPGGGSDTPVPNLLSESFRNLSHQRDGDVGFAILNGSRESVMTALREFYGKKK